MIPRELFFEYSAPCHILQHKEIARCNERASVSHFLLMNLALLITDDTDSLESVRIASAAATPGCASLQLSRRFAGLEAAGKMLSAILT